MRDPIDSGIPNHARRPRAAKAPVLWIVFCAFCNGLGWILSALRQLNARGYIVGFALGLVAFAWWRSRNSHGLRRPRWRVWRRRFSRLAPAVFLIFATLAFVTGALFQPANYDALAYRVPRVLHWLAAGHWHWIHTGFQRVNVRGCGAEWLSAPVIALLKTDRPLFLFSFIPFCLLPGLTFTSFRRIGITPRVAYSWMWLLPLGCCFLLQAGDLGNDLLAAAFMLAGFVYALKARQEKWIQDFWISMVAVGLSTGVKATAMPLGLVWLVVGLPCWRLWFAKSLPRLGGTIAIGLIAALVSFMPTAFFNWQQSRDWTGSIIEDQPFKAPNVWARMFGNLEMTAALNLQPPVAPFAKTWNERVVPRLTPPGLQEKFRENLQHVTGHPLDIDEMQTDISGLGLQVSALLLCSTFAAIVAARREKSPGLKMNRTQKMVTLATGIAYLAFIKTCFVRSLARLLASFYPFFSIPLLLHPGHERIVRGVRWRLGVIVVALLTAVPVLIRADRPLVPMRQLLRAVEKKRGPRPWITRALTVYDVYAERGDAFAPAVAALPPGIRVLGVVTFDDPEASLWKPFGSRRIVHVCAGDTVEDLRAQGVRYVLLGPHSFERVLRTTDFEGWLRQMNGTVVQTIPLRLRAGEGTVTWTLVRLSEAG